MIIALDCFLRKRKKKKKKEIQLPMTVIVGGLPYRESVANISHSPLTALQLTHNFTTASPR